MMENCEHLLKQNPKGFKLSGSARSYNATVNHRRRILSTTSGHPARWNDKTIVLFDDFVSGIRSGKYLSDVELELYERDEEGNVITAKYKGGWLIVDNGYLRWSTTVPPFKASSSQAELRWSKWVESMRKDVECTFGILKGRWRILKTGIRLKGTDATDKVWMTCCALHNWLLDIDGLDSEWENGVPSDWEGEMGEHDLTDVLQYSVPAIDMLNSTAELVGYDSSGIGAEGYNLLEDFVEQVEGEEDEDETLAATLGTLETDDAGFVVVRNLNFHVFRAKLV
jgi:DDE superfamily endonuclease